MVSPTEEMPSRKRIVPMPPHASAAGQRQYFVANGAGTTRSDLVLVGRIDVGSLNLRIVMAREVAICNRIRNARQVACRVVGPSF